MKGLNRSNLKYFILLALISCNSVRENERNPYGLEIIATEAEYLQSVAANPDKKLADLEKFITGIVPDIRYATKNNFTGQQIYSAPKAFARKPVAEALLKVQKELNSLHLGLKIFDAYSL